MLDQIKPANSIFPPQKFLIYGVPGIGKTSFAATFAAPVLLPIEDGASAVDIQAFPIVTTWQQIIDAIQALHGDHQFKTLVIDSMDWLEPIIWRATCDHFGKESIESFGYGKGYIEVDRWWRHLMAGLDSLRFSKGMDIVLLAHSEIKTITPPDTDSYDTYQLKMQKRAFALWVEWAETVMFLNYKVIINKTITGINQERIRGTGTGDRIIYTAERPSYKAKSRWPLPEEIIIGKDKSWSAFHEHFSAATNGKYINPVPPKKEKTK
ncbi:MAG: ATP-binding protein [Desulfuromonadales bacterium]